MEKGHKWKNWWNLNRICSLDHRNVNFLVLTTVPWLCKLLTLGILGEGYMGTLQTIFATSLQIYSPNKQFFIKNALCGLRDDLGYRQEPKTQCQRHAPLFVVYLLSGKSGISLVWALLAGKFSILTFHPTPGFHSGYCLWHMFIINILWQNNCPKALFCTRIRQGEDKQVRVAASYPGKKTLRETKEKRPKHFVEAAFPKIG